MSSNNPTISIIIQLDSNLNLIAGSFVNDELAPVYERTVELDPQSIRLYTIFEAIWADLIEQTRTYTIENILFLVGPHAGFTDSRIIYVWLQSHRMMYPETVLHTTKNLHERPLKEITNQELEKYIKHSTLELNYSSEPRIGTKQNAL